MTLQEVSPRSILAISVVLALAPANVHAGVSDIVPKPVQLVAAPGAFALTEQTVLTATPGAEREAQQLASWLRASSGCELPSRYRGGNQLHRAGIGSLIGNVAR